MTRVVTEQEMQDTKASIDAIKAKFTPNEIVAHGKLREQLWVLYPSEETLNIKPEADTSSDACAAMIMDGLRVGGFRIVPV